MGATLDMTGRYTAFRYVVRLEIVAFLAEVVLEDI